MCAKASSARCATRWETCRTGVRRCWGSARTATTAIGSSRSRTASTIHCSAIGTTVSTTYGVLYERFGSFGLHGVTKRSVFVLDADGVIRYKWVTEDPKVPPDHERILEEVKKHVT